MIEYIVQSLVHHLHHESVVVLYRQLRATHEYPFCLDTLCDYKPNSRWLDKGLMAHLRLIQTIFYF